MFQQGRQFDTPARKRGDLSDLRSSFAKNRADPQYIYGDR